MRLRTMPKRRRRTKDCLCLVSMDIRQQAVMGRQAQEAIVMVFLLDMRQFCVGLVRLKSLTVRYFYNRPWTTSLPKSLQWVAAIAFAEFLANFINLSPDRSANEARHAHLHQDHRNTSTAILANDDFIRAHSGSGRLLTPKTIKWGCS